MSLLCSAVRIRLLCCDKIGGGVFRDVFSCRIQSDLVVKVEIDQEWRSFENVKAMRFWSEWQYVVKIKLWLAPCEYLSPDGRILLQRRADPIPASFELLDKLPTFLTDIKRENFGLFEGRLVCIDYAMTIMDASTRLKKAEW